ncbi:MAG: membrane protein insertion efficiency factor YidD [Fibromonadaceae bacterium]|nr:membrane protein insertion efficiency factor YidD [Fibromonadaceae bacterium]
MKYLSIKLIKLYQKVHPAFFGGCCRFYPSCSSYAIEALELHGFFKGMALTVWRILRCQPFCKGGFDPPPAPRAP